MPPMPDDPRSNAELFHAALAERDRDARWTLVAHLHRRGSPEALATALALCDSPDADERTLGVDVLSQFGACTAHPAECASTYRRMLASEQDASVLAALGGAVGHLYEEHDFLDLVLPLATHADAGVRFGVVAALRSHDFPRALGTLISLSADEDDDVRDWATFELGAQLELDTPDLRDALAARLDDPHDDTRAEAIMGLATRHDARAFPALQRALSAESVGTLEIEAAKVLADHRLHPLLVAIRESWPEQRALLDDAIAACAAPDRST